MREIFLKLFIVAITIFIVGGCFSQKAVIVDSSKKIKTDSVKEKDLADVYHSIFNSKKYGLNNKSDSGSKYHLSFFPAIGYTLQTGFAVVLSANIAYYTDTKSNTKLSSINTNFTYSQYHQIMVPLIANIWSKGNKWNFITDFRYIDYPSDIYGLGGRTDPNKGVTINFQAIKFHQTVLREVSKDFYAGLGFYYDKFWNIKAIDPLTRLENALMQRELGKTENISGITFRALYDTRLNQINPDGGSYLNIALRQNMKALGSDSASQSLLIDARTYLHFPQNSKNILAFWAMDWLSPQGPPPYLILPSTGWDDQYNTGRGYIQGRFRGKSMVYFEGEYRYRITRNGLVGGVAFVNLQNFSSDISTQFSQVFMGYGAGLRIRLNKHSNTNLCIDYGIGQNGSGGFFVNLGEVF
jgi:hypothetical protein